MSFEINSEMILPCIGNNAADATGATGVAIAVATTAGSVAHTIPSGMKGRFVDLLVVGANTQYVITLEGDTAPTLTYNAISVLGTGNPVRGRTLVDSSEKPVFFPPNAKTLTVISSGTAGFFEAQVSGIKK